MILKNIGKQINVIESHTQQKAQNWYTNVMRSVYLVTKPPQINATKVTQNNKKVIHFVQMKKYLRIASNVPCRAL